MKIAELLPIIEECNGVTYSTLTSKRLTDLLELLETKLNVIGINDDVFDLYVNLNDVCEFFSEDVSDAGILFNIIFDIPEVKEYISSKAWDRAAYEETSNTRNINMLFYLTSMNLVISIGTFILTAFR